MVRTAALILFLATSASSATQEQFDLICTGKQTTSNTIGEKPVSVRYRVNLANNNWCGGDCSTGMISFAEVTASKLTLLKTEPQFATDDDETTTIDRISGDWSIFVEWHKPRYVSTTLGKCSASAYTGDTVPQPKF